MKIGDPVQRAAPKPAPRFGPLTEAILESFEKEPKKWRVLSDRIEHPNGCELYASSGVVRCFSDPAVAFTTPEEKVLWSAITVLRREYNKRKNEEGQKRALARFGK